MRPTSLFAIITACAATATVTAGDFSGKTEKTSAKNPTPKISFSTSLSLQSPLAESGAQGSKPEEKAEDKKSLEQKPEEQTDSRNDRMPLLEESLTSSVGTLYDARAITQMMEYQTVESLAEWSIFARSTWDLGVLGIWKIGQGEIDPVNEESIRASIGLKPLRPIINPEIAFTDRIRLSQFDGLKVFLDDKHILSVGLKA